MLQTVGVVTIIAVCATVLAWRLWHRLAKRSCGCEHCPSTPKHPPSVPLR